MNKTVSSPQSFTDPSPNRSRFTFFVGRKKTPTTRRGSVRRNNSSSRDPGRSLRRGPSSRITATGQRLNGATRKRQSQQLSQLQADTENVDKVGTIAESHCKRASATSCQQLKLVPPPPLIMPKDKDSDLPPLPQTAPSPQTGPGLLKRLTTKLRTTPAGGYVQAGPPLSSATPAEASGSGSSPPISKPKRKTTLKLPSMPAMPKGPTPALPNSFISPEHRQAALRARGLIPAVPHPYKDSHGYMLPLSEQEQELDKRFTVLMEHESGGEEEAETEAKRIREAWLKKNQDNQVLLPTSSAEGETETEKEGAIESERERASALAVPKDDLVISRGRQRSTPRTPPLKAYSPPISPTALTLGGSPPSHLAPKPVPEDVPLPASPNSHTTPPTTPRKARTSTSPPSSEASHRITKWLQSTPKGSSLRSAGAEQPGSPRSIKPGNGSDRDLDVDEVSSPTSPAGASLRSIKGRKEKPSPIAVHPSSSPALLPSSTTGDVFVTPQSPPIAFEDPRSPRRPSLPTLSVSPPPAAPASPEISLRGRSKTVGKPPDAVSPSGAIALAPSTSYGTEARSRKGSVPALSPTRTASSCSPSDVPPTPTTTFDTVPSARKSSSISIASQSSEGHAIGASFIRRGRRPTGNGLKIATSGFDESEEDGAAFKLAAATVIVESPVETAVSPEPTPRPRPTARQSTEERRERGDRRMSVNLGLFGSKSNEDNHAQSGLKAASSMGNLRRSIVGTISKLQRRPKSTVVIPTSTSAPDARRPTRGYDASQLPPSPSFPLPNPTSPVNSPPSAFSQGAARPRPRQTVSPTIHSRGSILLEASGIADAESRRLSEMAFLDF